MSEVIFDLINDAKPYLITGEDDSREGLAKHSDFVSSMQSTQSVIAQQVTQNNAESTRLNKLINGQGLTALTGISTLGDTQDQVNSIITILQNLVLNGKQ